jgi:hypothetical protein
MPSTFPSLVPSLSMTPTALPSMAPSAKPSKAPSVSPSSPSASPTEPGRYDFLSGNGRNPVRDPDRIPVGGSQWEPEEIPDIYDESYTQRFEAPDSYKGRNGIRRREK